MADSAATSLTVGWTEPAGWASRWLSTWPGRACPWPRDAFEEAWWTSD